MCGVRFLISQNSKAIFAMKCKKVCICAHTVFSHKCDNWLVKKSSSYTTHVAKRVRRDSFGIKKSHSVIQFKTTFTLTSFWEMRESILRFNFPLSETCCPIFYSAATEMSMSTTSQFWSNVDKFSHRRHTPLKNCTLSKTPKTLNGSTSDHQIRAKRDLKFRSSKNVSWKHNFTTHTFLSA